MSKRLKQIAKIVKADANVDISIELLGCIELAIEQERLERTLRSSKMDVKMRRMGIVPVRRKTRRKL